MRRLWSVCIVGLVLAVTASAQSPQREGPRPERGRGMPDRQVNPVLVDELTRSLDLTPEQREQLVQILQEERGPRGRLGAGGPRGQSQNLGRPGAEDRPEGRPGRGGGQGPRGGGDFIGRVLERLEPTLTAEQKARVPEVRERLSARGALIGGTILDRVSRLKAQLELDEGQSAEFDRHFAVFSDRYTAAEAEQKAHGDALIEELREAAEAGDVARIAALREELQSTDVDTDAALFEFLDQIEPILHEDQLWAWERHTRQFTQRSARRGGEDVRRLLAAARRLELDRNERQQLRDLERQVQRTAREARRDPDANRRLYELVRGELVKMVGEEQVAELEQQAQRRGPMGDRPPRRGDGRRPPPPDDDSDFDEP